jgi:hypothetical protein
MAECGRVESRAVTQTTSAKYQGRSNTWGRPGFACIASLRRSAAGAVDTLDDIDLA